MQAEIVSGYQFRPTDLNIAARTAGISAYIRTRNGADFIEPTIRSHLPFYDEIVVVYNQCEDNTADILARLKQEIGPKLRLFHYTDRVQPLGSKGHAKTPWNSPESMVNYSNFAMVKTRHKIVVKLDDDHLAIPGRVEKICNDFRRGIVDQKAFHSFSGLNIARAKDGTLGIPVVERVSGNGDIGYFLIDEDTYFVHDRRFERFDRGKLKRVFSGFYYWHMKFLKTGSGFRNYELGANPDSRFAKKETEFAKTGMYTLPEVCKAMTPSRMDRLSAKAAEKLGHHLARDESAAMAFPDASLLEALDRLNPGWQDVPGLGFIKD